MGRKKNSLNQENPHAQVNLRESDLKRLDKLGEFLDFSVTKAGLVRAAITLLERFFAESDGTDFENFVQAHKKSVSCEKLGQV